MMDPRRAKLFDKIVQEETQRQLRDNPPDEEIVLICCFEGSFEDDLTGVCSVCGKKVQFRPTAPEPSRKVCIVCSQQELDKLPEDSRNQTSELIQRILGRVERETRSN